MSVPCISPSGRRGCRGTRRRRGSSARIASKAVSRQHRAPAVDDDVAALLSTAAISARADRVRESLGESRRSTAPSLNSDEPTMTRAWRRARISSRAFRRPDAAADAAGQSARRSRRRALRCRLRSSRRRDRSAAPWESREAFDPAVDVVGLEGEPFALNELDDPAALEIDGGISMVGLIHRVLTRRRWAPRRAGTASARRRRARSSGRSTRRARRRPPAVNTSRK